MPRSERCGYIVLVFVDHERDAFIEIGGAGFPAAEARQRFARLPAEEGSDFIADFFDHAGNHVDERPVSGPLCEVLLGEPLAALVAAGRDLDDRRVVELTARLRSRGASHAAQ